MSTFEERTIREPHGEPKYIDGPDGVLSYRITSSKLTNPSTEREALLARVEADVLARNEPYPVDMYCWAGTKFEDGTEGEGLVRVRYDDQWTVVAVEQVVQS